MDFGLRLGLFITFILSGFGFMFISECIGIGFLILAGVWGILFVNPRSPIRKWCWSVSGKLGITIEGLAKGNRQYLTVPTTLRTLTPIRVDKISLHIGRRKIIPLNWKVYEVTGDGPRYINFNRPKWLYSGKHSARLIAYTPYGYSKSEKFIIAVKD